MNRITDKMTWIAMALVAVVIVGVITPVCAMPDCNDVAADTCSDYAPACDDCPDQIVMKHSHDDAVGSASHPVEPPVAIAAAELLPQPTLVAAAFATPTATASPPPLDPLGVRLTV